MISRTLLTLSALFLAAPASAQGVYPYGPVTTGGADFAGPFVRGTYIGAPLTRVPRPTEIVPSAWSYGTYGIPTVTGIAASPAQQPSITVINATGPAPRPTRERRTERVVDSYAAGPQIITVQVPRR
ncbi:hypothetical protein [Methylobacterium pseudosasicola]|uniref:Uncharacterized protein n=1 Tax=Methylobacterium pseudosasicola TaxID=582667 RepID=A0A1I4PKH1_9HYPH|nr:hypothetical protein [Methylobacterium pseudosasicola]SFM28329.1 hypothetical protein SAMN05192568_102540 [Methylobacterium pseudosasicola]